MTDTVVITIKRPTGGAPIHTQEEHDGFVASLREIFEEPNITVEFRRE